MNNNKLITIFTPSYNRAHLLIRTYESLKKQTDLNFIWLIVDDGSSDGTKELVEEWIKKENSFEIRYVYKENGGMHTAHNKAYEIIDTELNVCIDSDDCMPPSAIEHITKFWINNKSESVAGIVALDSDLEGNIIGTMLPSDIKEATTDELYERYGVCGDKKFIYRTDIINSVEPYPEFLGEKLVPLGYKYSLVADKYSMLLMNDVVCEVDYQSDGSSNTIYKQYLQSPRGFAVGKIVRMTRTNSVLKRWKYIVHYIAECRIAKDAEWLNNSPLKVQTILLYPLGIMLEKWIYYQNKRV